MKKKNIGRKTVLYFGTTIVFVFFIILIISSWGKEEAQNDNFVESMNIKNKKNIPPKKKITGNNDNIDISDEVDPRLKKIFIREIISEPEEELTPEQKKHEKLLGIIKQPVNLLAAKLSSFVYEGEMKMNMPTFNTDEESFKAGKRYGKSEEVISRFKYIKDEEGNYSIFQETESASKTEKYKKNSYNGELRYMNGEYSYSDANGANVNKDSVDKIVTENEKKNNEPYVKSNWVKLIQDISKVIAFEVSEKNDNLQNYEIKGANPELQKNTTELTEIHGNITIDEETGVMSGSSITGIAKLHDGYMSGADVGFSINLELKAVGQVANIDD